MTTLIRPFTTLDARELEHLRRDPRNGSGYGWQGAGPVEPAPTGRSRCRGCGSRILKGQATAPVFICQDFPGSLCAYNSWTAIEGRAHADPTDCAEREPAP